MSGKGAKSFTLPVYFEAVPGYALPPGVFFHDLDNNQVFYNPVDGQTVTDLSTDAWVSTKEVLLSYAHATGHTWEHVNFRYSTWLQPNSPDGFVDTQSAVHYCTPNAGHRSSGQAEPFGAVQVANSTLLTFHLCSFMHIGSAYAISVWKSSKHITIDANTFQDLSGIMLDDTAKYTLNSKVVWSGTISQNSGPIAIINGTYTYTLYIITIINAMNLHIYFFISYIIHT